MTVKVENKDNILNVALKLFSKCGYESVGVQLLCERAGVTKPTLYYYFGNKVGVLKELLRVNYDKLNSLIENNAKYSLSSHNYSEDVYPVMLRVAQAYFDFAQNNNKFYQMVLQATFGPKTSFTTQLARELNFKQYEIIENMFKNFSKVHDNMQGKEKRLSYAFIGMINTYIAMGDFTDNLAENAVKNFMHGIFS